MTFRKITRNEATSFTFLCSSRESSFERLRAAGYM